VNNRPQVFYGGVPTDLELRKLRDAYPEADMRPGTVIKYSEIETLIEVKNGTSRWASVTNRWRRTVERETRRLIIGVKRGVGFKILDATEQLELCEGKMNSGVRAFKRGLRVSVFVDPAELSDSERARLDFAQRKAGAILATARLRAADNLPTLKLEPSK